jgi:hypothetical protein
MYFGEEMDFTLTFLWMDMKLEDEEMEGSGEGLTSFLEKA